MPHLDWTFQWHGEAAGTCLNDEDDVQAAVADYVQAQKEKGQPAFIDACHFQLPWSVYPSEG